MFRRHRSASAGIAVLAAGAALAPAAQTQPSEDASRFAAQVADWEYQLRRADAHARMPNTLYASTPTDPNASDADPSCPVLRDGEALVVLDDIRRSRPADPARTRDWPRPVLATTPQPEAAGRWLLPQQARNAAAIQSSADGGMDHALDAVLVDPLAADGVAVEGEPPAAAIATAAGDFNGDGRQDLLLRHADGRWRIYAMDGLRTVAAASGIVDGLTTDRAWRFKGVGDFNGDGRDDVLLRHDDGRWRIDALDGFSRVDAASGEASLTRNPSYDVAGIGDFDGDGKDDVLIRSADRGAWYYYPMDGTAVRADGRGFASLTRNPAYRPAAVADFDGDGTDDVLLRKDAGQWYYYPMNGRVPHSAGRGVAGLTANLAYGLAGVGDFDGDGMADALLRKDSGAWYFYPMHGRTVRDGRGFASLTRDTAYQPVAAGDFDGDGRADIMLREDDGTWYQYRLDGRAPVADDSGVADLAAGPAWRMADLRAPGTFQDCDACPPMVEVPTGSFRMGSPPDEALRGSDEGPQRQIAFDGFAIGAREVTFAEWDACVADGGCAAYRPSDYGWGRGDQPVFGVTWQQANAYAAWLREETGQLYRLPTEAEWEYAARAGTRRAFTTGSTILTDRANYDGTQAAYGDGVRGVFRQRPVAAGSFGANAFGLRDVHGNVAEWVHDCYAPSYAGASPDGAAQEPAACAGRVVRGGSWRDEAAALRSAARDRRPEGTNENWLGFRVAKGAGALLEPADPATDLFAQTISPIIQSQCIRCHVAGGQYPGDRFVFVSSTDSQHLAKNLQTFRSFVANVADGSQQILDKVSGRIAHTGGALVPAGSDAFKSMETFLGTLATEAPAASIAPEALFDGVAMESSRQTLRRAALIFGGRVPTAREYRMVFSGSAPSMRRAIKRMMAGPAFHDFLTRAANDRLLTDRDLGPFVVDPIFGLFVDFNNLNYDKRAADDPRYWQWRREVGYGIGRAPLELIAHVAQNDLPYTEILTGDYLMANPMAAQAYGDREAFESAFADPADAYEFQPSRIVSYYRNGRGKQTEFSQEFGNRVINAGPLLTDYPHAGLLNSTVFLYRYPTTATNRNRARARWTYYHFLGVDVEKSASRTTDPAALADTDNPTMKNPACTVCHSALDPVAGAFQNYGDRGLYRDQYGGLDSLDGLYKHPEGQQFEISADSEGDPQTVQAAVDLTPHGRLYVRFPNDYYNQQSRADRNLRLDRLAIFDADGAEIYRLEFEDLPAAYIDARWEVCGMARHETHVALYGPCYLDLPFEAPAAGEYRVEVVLWADQAGGEIARLDIGEGLYRHGDAWYRDMREPGFAGMRAPGAERSLPWLADRIVADPRFAEATVKFWWPALMGSAVAEPPAESGDADYESRLLAATAQGLEVTRLAGEFRRGIGGGKPYSLKDLLAEMVLSPWFRAHSTEHRDPLRLAALQAAGAKRLLNPEELARKTVTLTGFDWHRVRRQHHHQPGARLNWTNPQHGFGLLYGGIDSDGITERVQEMTSVMVGVAQRHAAAASCPVVMKEFYLLPDAKRRLFGGIDPSVSPISEFSAVREVEAVSAGEAQTVSVVGDLTRGAATVRLSYPNPGIDGDRNLYVDRLDVLDPTGSTIASIELEDVATHAGCRHNQSEGDSFGFYCEGYLDVAIDIPAEGRYTFEVSVWADRYGDELAKVDIAVGTDIERSAGAQAIKAHLVGLYDRLLGVQTDAASADVQDAFDFFVHVWERGRHSGEVRFRDGSWTRGTGFRCEYVQDQHYFDGIADHLWRTELNKWGNQRGWDWPAIDAFFAATRMPDPHYAARAWVAVLAHLLTDYRYLHL